MILFIGGLIGAGKTSMAEAVVDHYRFHYYGLDEVKREIYSRYPETRACFAEGVPVDLRIRRQVFEKAARDLKALARHYPNILMDEVFHIRAFRHILFDAAREAGRPYLFIWVHAKKEIILERLSGPRKGHVLDNPIPMHLAMAEEFEDFNQSVIYCANNRPIEQSAADLFRLIGHAARLAEP